jgi:hypothetical protein
MLNVTSIVLQLVGIGVVVGPELIAAAQTEIALVTSNTAPTAEQQASIDAALDAANAALQAAVPSGNV